MASTSRFNGGLKLTVAALIGLLTGGLAGGMFLGGQAAQLRAHVQEAGIHETVKDKEDRIDSRVLLHLAPLNKELQQMKRQLDRIEKKVDR